MKKVVTIVSPHLWPRFFRAIGVYDILYDKIFIQGGLSGSTHRQVEEHENAHRKWFLKHQTIRKVTVFLWVKPALYYAFAIVAAIFSILSVWFGLRSFAFWSAGVALVLFFLNLFFWIVFFEIPAWGAAGFIWRGTRVKDSLKTAAIDAFTMITPFLLMAIGLWFFGPTPALGFLSFGLLISWIFLIYTFLWTLVILRKVASQ